MITNAIKIRMAAGIRKRFRNMLLDHSFLFGHQGSVNSHGSRSEIFRKNNRPIGAAIEFLSVEIRAFYFSAALDPA